MISCPVFAFAMRVLKRSINGKNGEGAVTLMAEEPEDMWHIFNLVAKGDTVRGSTMRKVRRLRRPGGPTPRILIECVALPARGAGCAPDKHGLDRRDQGHPFPDDCGANRALAPTPLGSRRWVGPISALARSGWTDGRRGPRRWRTLSSTPRAARCASRDGTRRKTSTCRFVQSSTAAAPPAAGSLPLAWRQMGAYHTIDLELNRSFRLGKPCWDALYLERLRMASDVQERVRGASPRAKRLEKAAHGRAVHCHTGRPGGCRHGRGHRARVPRHQPHDRPPRQDRAVHSAEAARLLHPARQGAPPLLRRHRAGEAPPDTFSSLQRLTQAE